MYNKNPKRQKSHTKAPQETEDTTLLNLFNSMSKDCLKTNRRTAKFKIVLVHYLLQ